ncbi:MAG: zf-HC2 domain-containing protein [Terriglobales bacterium]
MAEVPKIARDRLAQAAPGDHPDANLLTAFAEGALTAKERSRVLAHLGGCAECREVVALALPEIAEAPPLVETKTTLLGWPVLRWAGVAAAVIVVAAAVSLRQRNEPAPFQAPAAPPAAVQNQQAAPTASQPVAASSKQDAAVAKEKKVEQPVATQNRVRVKAAPTTAAALPRAATPSTVELEARAPSAAAAASEVSTRKDAPQAAPPPVQLKAMDALSGQAGKNVATGGPVAAAKSRAAKGAAVISNENVSVVADSATVTSFAKAAYWPPLRWQVSGDGHVERSMDLGKTWQKVTIIGSAPVFRAIAALDGEVWAGGAAGALYHSVDHGANWLRIEPAAGEDVLSANILRINFVDRAHGTVVTSNGETWSTSDAGASWTVSRKQ